MIIIAVLFGGRGAFGALAIPLATLVKAGANAWPSGRFPPPRPLTLARGEAGSRPFQIPATSSTSVTLALRRLVRVYLKADIRLTCYAG